MIKKVLPRAQNDLDFHLELALPPSCDGFRILLGVVSLLL